MNRSVAGAKATRLVRATATLLAAGVLTLTAQGAAHAAEAKPAPHPASSASVTLPKLPSLPNLPVLPDVLGPVVDTLDGNHDWGVLPVNPNPGQVNPNPAGPNPGH